MPKRKSKTKQNQFWLEQIAKGGGGMYPGIRQDDVPPKVANRLCNLNHITSYHPHNFAHKARWQITSAGRLALDKGDTSDADREAFGKVWDGECDVCGGSPTVAETGLCGPCTFGDAKTIGGNW